MQYLRGDRKKKTATALQCYPSRVPFYSREIAKNSTSRNRTATINFDLTLDIVKSQVWQKFLANTGFAFYGTILLKFLSSCACSTVNPKICQIKESLLELKMSKGII